MSTVNGGIVSRGSLLNEPQLLPKAWTKLQTNQRDCLLWNVPNTTGMEWQRLPEKQHPEAEFDGGRDGLIL